MADLTPEERKNGWTEASLEDYRAEREAMTGHASVHRGQLRVQSFVPGNIVTEWDRPRAPIRIENTHNFNPHKHWR